jgi:alkanesulfonate monooxygenase SsuD/methylene tetrahydromethanopterin reductase-like flavin-dependent oxidoreductase (luciferase family)
MKAIWTQDEPFFEGELVKFPSLWSWPKPLQKPHPPVLLGGHGPRALARVVDYADGWLPIGVVAGDLVEGIGALRTLARERGRNPDVLSVTVYGLPHDPGELRRLSDAGVTRGIFALPSAGADVVLPLLDKCAGVARRAV